VLGQDNDEVLGDLGVEAEKRAELEQEGVIGRQPAAGRMPAAGQRVVEYPQLVESGLVEEYDPDFAIRLGLEREPRSRTRGADDRSR
jgi:hypothetical protein